MRDGSFPDPDEPIDDGGLDKVRAVVLRPAPEFIVAAPTLAAHQTAQALDLAVSLEPALADIDHGAWRGRSLTEIQAVEPETLMGWILDPASGAPNGEAFTDVLARVGAWMATQAASNRRVLAITHPAVMRAALAHVLDMPPSAAFRVDIAPLSRLTLSFNRQWRVQGLGGEGIA